MTSDEDTPVSDIDDMDMGSDDDTYKPPPQSKKMEAKATPTRVNRVKRQAAAGSTTSYDEKSHSEDEEAMYKPKAPAVAAAAAATGPASKPPPVVTTASPAAAAAAASAATASPKSKRGRKKKSDVSKLKAEDEQGKSDSTDNDGISWGAPIKRTPGPADTVVVGKPEPPMGISVRSPTPPDPALLPNNPLIPRPLYGFDLPAAIQPSKSDSSKSKTEHFNL